MQPSIFKRLDEIEKLNPDPSTGQELEASQLMNSFARSTDDLRILVERYAGSTTAIMAQSLAYVLAVRAQKPSQEMAHLVLSFIARFRCWNHDGGVMNSLTAVQHCLHYVDASAGEELRHLSSFFRRCLEYSGRLWVIIKGHALALLPIIWERDLVNRIFTEDELLWLREKVRELQKTAGEELHEELRDVEYLAQE